MKFDECDSVNFFLRIAENDPNFSRKMLWTNECKFTNNGMFNRHNEYTWATKKSTKSPSKRYA